LSEQEIQPVRQQSILKKPGVKADSDIGIAKSIGRKSTACNTTKLDSTIMNPESECDGDILNYPYSFD